MGLTAGENDALHKRSGEVMDDDPLVRFLYLLMRDHLPTGVVEGIVQSDDKVIHFTNGFLARYAQDMAARLAGRVPPTSG
jgi:hypothetical protein